MAVQLLSGNEAVALAALDAGVALGAGYPGTPSTEILEYFHEIGGNAEWSPNEKVAMEVALGAAFGGGRAIATMKHVGLNVAADVLFTAAYSGVSGALVVVSADDPGMASSQNEQDNRRYAVAAGVPMFEPADSQEAYDFTLTALDVSARWQLPVLLRMTTRVCHSKTLVRSAGKRPSPPPARFERNIRGRVMIPAHARPAHRRLRQKLAEIAAWNETWDGNREYGKGDSLHLCAAPEGPFRQMGTVPFSVGNGDLGLIASGITFMHVREAAPQAAILKLGMTYPLPLERIRRFVAGVKRAMVVEENDPYLFEQLRAADIRVEQKPEMYRYGEFDVARVRRILSNDTTPEAAPPPGKPPALCVGCPHRAAFAALKKFDCIVSGDIGCYTLGALPPLEAMDSQICMGASMGIGLGLRHVLPDDQARRVVSVIGDSTFIHSGITGLVEMVYNPPKTGHVALILDNGTTAMTGLQEHPGTGRKLGHEPTGRVVLEDLARGLGIKNVAVLDPVAEPEKFEQALRDALDHAELSVLIVRRPCLLNAGKIKQREKEKGREERGEGIQPHSQSALTLTLSQRERGHDSKSPNPRIPESRIPESRIPESRIPESRIPESRIPESRIPVTSVVIAGLGGQGVLLASDILAEAAFLSGCDVKKSEVHGMAQRGGSVASDVRFGGEVLSPMVPPGEADFLLVLAEDQVENNRPRMKPDGVLIAPDAIDPEKLPNRRSTNVALLGVLSQKMDLALDIWLEAIRNKVKPELFEVNRQAFELGRNCG